jgi:2,3-dihydroxybenzoate decarboxylase
LLHYKKIISYNEIIEEVFMIDRRDFIKKSLMATALFSTGVDSAHAAEKASGPGTIQKTSKTAFKKIAIEEHWAYEALGKVRQGYDARVKSPLKMTPEFFSNYGKRVGDFENLRLPAMDENGIMMQIIATGSPGVQGVIERDQAVSLAKEVNDLQAKIIAKHPSRFAGLAALPLQDPKAAADELERAVTKLRFRGAMIQGHCNGEYLDQQKFWVVWERAAALDVPLYLHITDPASDQIKIYDGYPDLLGASWGWVVEAATHSLRIVYSGVFDAFPKATLILGHMGEMLPYILARLDEGYDQAVKVRKLKKPISSYVLENIMVTTSGWFRPPTLRCAVDAMGADRVLFATDYPFVDTDLAVKMVEDTPLSDREKESIYYLNAKRVFKLT